MTRAYFKLCMENVIMKLRCPKKHHFLVNHAFGTMFNYFVLLLCVFFSYSVSGFGYFCVELVFQILVLIVLCVNLDLNFLILCLDFLFAEMEKGFWEKRRRNRGGLLCLLLQPCNGLGLKRAWSKLVWGFFRNINRTTFVSKLLVKLYLWVWEEVGMFDIWCGCVDCLFGRDSVSGIS